VGAEPRGFKPHIASVEKKLSDQPPAIAGKSEASAARPLRADARRNRDRLVEVAAQAFAELGVDGSLEDIARRAGVGIGTLYRHFPTREHLVEVVYRREVEGLCAAADELLAARPAGDALAEWMQRFVGYIAAKRGMAESLKLLLQSKSDLFAETSGKIPAAFRRLVEAAVAEGSIRADIEPADILQALSGIYGAPDTPDWQDRSRRLMRLLVDGLRVGASGRPAGAP
jgi:AcrR family transcriptional regulator